MRNLYLLLTGVLFLFSLNSCVLTEADDPATISGTITDTYGDGLPEVTIQINSRAGKENIQTDSNGKYSISLPSGGAAVLTFSKEKFTTQIKDIEFNGGARKVVNLKMTSLEEDSYFDIKASNIYVKKINGQVFASISTNVNYEAKCNDDWVKLTKSSSILFIDYDTNFTFEERTATINLVDEYGKTHNIKVVQEAGPPFWVTDYCGKDNKTQFYKDVPFITFTNDATIKSINSLSEELDLTPEYSADKRTVYLSNLKIPAFTPVTISYTAESPKEEILNGQFDLKAYINCVNTTTNTAQKILFTKDSKYCWVYTYTAGASTLIQYSANDLTNTGNIAWNQNKYSTVSYNRYNNCLYISEKSGSLIAIYDATTGAFIKEIDLSSTLKGSTVFDIEFAENGYGLTLVNGLLYAINSADNNTCRLFSADTSLYDPSNPQKLIVKTIAICNEGKTFVLTDKNGEINNVFTIDASTKSMTSYYNLRDYFYAASNAYPGIVLGSSKEVTYIDFSTGLKYNIASNYTGNRTSILITGDQLPTIMTSVFATISVKNGEQKKFELSNGAPSISNVYPSDDGKVMVITFNNKIYLFSQELFTKNSNKLK